MARIIEQCEMSKQIGDGAEGIDAYPWDEWLDGQPRELTKADDFPGIRATTMISYLRRAARARDTKIKILYDREQDSSDPKTTVKVQAVEAQAVEAQTVEAQTVEAQTVEAAE